MELKLREFYESYCGLAFVLEGHEELLLSILRTSGTFASLQQRFAVVEAERKTSSLGRQARRMNDQPLLSDLQLEIKVSTLSDDGFPALMETPANWELFASSAQVVKHQKVVPSVGGTEQLKSAFFEFFVCYLELEQFLEDCDYNPDEALELRPEVAERLEQSVEEYESGTVKAIPIEEVAKKIRTEVVMYRLEIMPKAEVDFARLDATIEQRILDKLKALCENCDTHRHEALRCPHKRKFRLRAANDYRVTYTFNRCRREIVVHGVDIGGAFISIVVGIQFIYIRI